VLSAYVCVCVCTLCSSYYFIGSVFIESDSFKHGLFTASMTHFGVVLNTLTYTCKQCGVSMSMSRGSESVCVSVSERKSMSHENIILLCL